MITVAVSPLIVGVTFLSGLPPGRDGKALMSPAVDGAGAPHSVRTRAEMRSAAGSVRNGAAAGQECPRGGSTPRGEWTRACAGATGPAVAGGGAAGARAGAAGADRLGDGLVSGVATSWGPRPKKNAPIATKSARAAAIGST